MRREDGKLERVPIVELPHASECQHTHVVYHYVDKHGNAQAVALHKEQRQFSTELWQPWDFYRKGPAGIRRPLSTKEMQGNWQAAVLAAYEELPGHRYDPKYTERDKEVYVRVNGLGFYARIQVRRYTHKTAVWVDEEGRVW